MSYHCYKCDKEFQSPEALAQHAKAAHAQALKDSKGKSNIKKYIFGAVLIAVVIILIYWAVSFVSPASQEDIDFAKCIADSGAKFYGAFWCSHCKTQKEMFGSSVKYLPYIECSPGQGKPQSSVCDAAGIEGYPTWVFPDNTRGSVMTLPELSQKTGCALP